MTLGTLLTPSANRCASRFLLASLNIEAILHESTIHRRREKLRKMTDGLELGDVYGATIERIKVQDGGKSRLGMAALMWISHAKRPLRADELCHALAVEIGSADFNTSNVPSMSTLVGCCHGLITVDKEASIVRLIHFTLQEYLSTHHDKLFGTPHSAITEICLTYLNSQQVKALSADASPDAHGMPFLEYCSVYWGIHAKRELSDCARSLALELLKGHYGEIPTKSLIGRLDPDYAEGWGTYSPFGGLHCASFFGIVELVTALIEMGCYDINEQDFLGCTPLAWAAHNGHEKVVEILLRRKEVNPDEPDSLGQTPLSHAAWTGHEGVVKLLLGREEVDPDKPDKDGRTPLSHATWDGHERVVAILLRRQEVNPGKSDMSGRTPLLFAAGFGREGVVRMLLGREEVNPDKPDRWNQSPLSLAAQRGHVGVVKLLLRREEVDPNKPDNSGHAPLSYAARNGHEAIVKALLQQQAVDPNKPNIENRTPLSLAAGRGHAEVVKILLGRDEVNPDQPDNCGQTPLSHAAQNDHKGVVALLLPRNVASSSTI